MKSPTLPPDTSTTANKRYVARSLGTWSSISDVDTFFSRFNHANDYKDGDVELALGNFVTIQDGIYNASWVIAGFDMEYNQTSADGNIYDNGHGICMIPVSYIGTDKWGDSNSIAGGYKSSYANNTLLPTITTNLQNVLGSHITERNVLLSSSVNSDYHSNEYVWTTAYSTFMSVGQITGSFLSHNNKYDDGEANYKLPIFNHISIGIGSLYYLRNIYGHSYDVYGGEFFASRVISSDNGIDYSAVYYPRSIRPLIYLR